MTRIFARLISLFLLSQFFDLGLESIGPASSEAAFAASGQAKASKRRPATRKKTRARHRRLKVFRSVKPMPALSEAPFKAGLPVLPLIEEAKSRLEKENVSYFPARGKQPARRQVKLALADFNSGEIRIVSGLQSNRNFSINAPDVQFRMDWWNGFNSSITILSPSNTAVVALLWALDAKRQKELGLDALIYCPYSNALLQPELVEAGRAYLLEKIAQARKGLAGVPSRAFAGVTLENSAAFSDEDYLKIILAEHMDPGRFRSISAGSVELSAEQETRLMMLAERILVIVGTNQEDAYRFTGSYAGARGLTQFTLVGMRVVWNNYPDAAISRDFRKATSEHVSAIKAEMCLLDHDLAELSRKYPGLMGSGAERYAAGASYNGGLTRVHYGLRNFGIDWLHPALRLAALAGKKSLERKERLEYGWLKRNRSHETFIYLDKLHAMERLSERLLGGVSSDSDSESASADDTIN